MCIVLIVISVVVFFFFKQKTAYEMRISDWSSDVCSSDLQKQLRLQEARRLILSASLDAASAGHRVGYDSASQFSREYSRLFGAPPMRDAARLRAQPAEPATV